MAKPENSRWKKHGDKIHVHAYIPEELYHALMQCAEMLLPGENKWESQIIRLALRDWVARQLGHRGTLRSGKGSVRPPVGRAQR